MGRFVRSFFALVGVFALLMAYAGALGDLRAAPGARVFTVGGLFALQLLCVGFVALLQTPFFAEAPTDARRPALRDLMWRAPEFSVGSLLLLGGLAASRDDFGGAVAALLGGFTLWAAWRRPVSPRPPARAAPAILFGLLQIYPGAYAVLVGIADVDAPDRVPFAVLGALILMTAASFILSGLRTLALLEPSIGA